jgi:hypothetical protein
LLVVFFHIGFSFWVLALYLGLCFAHRHDRRRVVAFLVEGAVIAAILLVVLLMNRKPLVGDEDYFQWMWKTFFRVGDPWRAVRRVLVAPMNDINLYMGLALFPGVAGWWLIRRRWPALAAMIALATFLFLLFYSFWPVDYGNYYLPLLPLWGLTAALGCQAVLRHGSPFQRALLFILMLVDVGLYVFVLRDRPTVEDPLSLAPIWTIGFYAASALTILLLPSPVRPDDAHAPSQRPRVIAYAALGLALQAAAYTPRAIHQSRFDDLGRSVAALRSIDPVSAYLQTFLISSHYRPLALAMTGIPLTSMGMTGLGPADGILYDDHPIARWLRNTPDPHSDNHVWFDDEALAYAREHWDDGVLADIPMDLFDFEPRREGSYLFHRARFKDPAEARRYFLRQDPYPSEDWGGVRVTWLRPVTQLWIEPRRGRLNLRYWIGHPENGNAYPVRVRIQIDGRSLSDLQCPRMGVYDVRLDLDLTDQTTATLTVRTDPEWISPERRHLGVALYPIQWSIGD